MATGRLSKRSVDELKPAATDQFLWDEDLGGFGLRVTSKGSRSYVFQYRMGGREAKARRFTIGRHGSPWTPEQARKEAERLLILVRQGIDPVQANLDRRRQAVELAFDAYVAFFTARYLKERWKQWQLGQRVLNCHVVPVLGDKPLPAIRRSDLNAIWDQLCDRPAVARLTYATLRKLFRWAVSRGDLDRSPLEGTDAPAAVLARDRVLSDIELSLVWKGTAMVGRPFDSLYRLLILTGQRREEVAGMQWGELDRAQTLWTLPSSRTKNRRPQLVHLSKLAVQTLDHFAAGGDWPSRGLVFSTNERTPVSGFSKAKRRLDKAMNEIAERGAEIPPWRITICGAQSLRVFKDWESVSR